MWWTIVDTHVSSLIAAAFLFPVQNEHHSRVRDHAHHRSDFQRLRQCSSPARCSSWCCRSAGRFRPSVFRALYADFYQRNFNFLRWRWHAIILSLVVIGAGVFVIATGGLPLGIDFSGGAAFVIEGASEGEIRSALDTIPGDKGGSAVRRSVEGADLGTLPQAEDGPDAGNAGAADREDACIRRS